MRSLLAPRADGVLANNILISPRPPITAHQYKDGKGSSKSTETSIRKTIY